VVILIFQDVQENRRHCRTHTSKCIVSLDSTELENRSGVNEYANTDNMCNVHCKFKPLAAHLMYGVHTLGVQVCGLHLSVGMWHFVPVSRHLMACDFVSFALFSGVYLNLLNY